VDRVDRRIDHGRRERSGSGELSTSGYLNILRTSMEGGNWLHSLS